MHGQRVCTVHGRTIESQHQSLHQLLVLAGTIACLHTCDQCTHNCTCLLSFAFGHCTNKWLSRCGIWIWLSCVSHSQTTIFGDELGDTYLRKCSINLSTTNGQTFYCMAGCCLESFPVKQDVREDQTVWLLVGKRRKTHCLPTHKAQTLPILLLVEHLLMNKCVYDQVHYESWLWTWRIIYSMHVSECSQPAHQSLDVFIVKIAQHAGYRVLNVHVFHSSCASIYALSSVGLDLKNIFPWQSTQNKQKLVQLVTHGSLCAYTYTRQWIFK